MLFLSIIFKSYIENSKRVFDILKVKIDDLAKDKIEERGLPGNKKFQKNGWWKSMLLRYGLAMHFSKGKEVLETCSGLGWGTYLLDSVAKNVICIEIDKKALDLSKRLWRTQKTTFVNASVLRIPTTDNRFDVVTAMESIEHFTLGDIKVYLGEIYRVLKKGGLLIGSSAFPDTKQQADILCSENKYHLHICTSQEIKRLLWERKFKKIRVFQNRNFFMARK